jgi:hypothetical protein
VKFFDWWGKYVTEEEEKQMLHRIEEKIKVYGGETAALLAIRAFKYVSYLGVMMGRFFMGPLTPIITHEHDVFLTTIGRRENLELLEEALDEYRRAKA